MSIIRQLRRLIRLEEKRLSDKQKFDNRPYIQKVYNQDDVKKFPKNPEKWRVTNTIGHNLRFRK